MITFIQELKMASETGRMSVSVTPEKQQKLDANASSLDRSRNWLVNQAIDHYLEIYDWRTKKIQERLDMASGKNVQFHSSDEVDAIINKFKT
ncbi:ribbon-helix-helix domain-containing protein [Nitrosomonas sp.]|uniref:CopG family ribbon-helix-helix protein n=2 Tax=Nitrosomonas sp. TaxID=42353 RepID=UPI003305F508